jgi:hypothetical protein
MGKYDIDLDTFLGDITGRWEPKTEHDCCRMLLSAVLDRAIRDFFGWTNETELQANHRGGKYLAPDIKRSAVKWIESNQILPPAQGLSFMYICQQLGLDPIVLRCGIYKLRAKLARDKFLQLPGSRGTSPVLRGRSPALVG